MAPTSPSKKASTPQSQSARPSSSKGSEDGAAASATRPRKTSTIKNGAASEPIATQRKPPENSSVETQPPDVFESSNGDDDAPEPPRASVDLDDLPIELVSLTDSFIDSLSAKIHPTPPNIDSLASRFQQFYELAATHIQTHTNSLATRQRRERSPSSSSSPRASTASLLRAKATSLGSKEKPKPQPLRRDSELQMLTADELASRKRARRALEQKRGLLEEAVERRLCEGIYARIYRHHTTQDEAQDDKLRSKTAALDVVGIGPADLGVDLGESAATLEATAERQEEVRKWLEPARKELVLMNQSRYPLGKLNRLKAAHKSIIDTLAHFHPSSSADELMPMLIYTLITLPPENLNVISDLHFIQRFRWEPKLVGEAAYCLTSLEATISFLENVDLSTLRADEAPSGPSKSPGGSEVARAETFPPAYSPSPSTPTQSIPEPTLGNATALKPTATSAGLRAAVQLRNRRLSDLVNTPAQALGAASDAVFNTADQGLKTIGTSLGDSYKFLLGKLREAPAGLTTSSGEVVVPKTLDDARKLIGTPPPDDDGSVSGASSSHGPDDADTHRPAPSREDKMLNLIGGRKPSRDHSADSSRSASSSKRFIFTDAAKEKATTTAGAASSSSSSSTAPAVGASNPALLDSMRNIGNTFNPMNRLTSIGGFRGFGRTSSTPAAPAAKDAAGKGPADGGDLAAVSVLSPLVDIAVADLYRCLGIPRYRCSAPTQRASQDQSSEQEVYGVAESRGFKDRRSA